MTAIQFSEHDRMLHHLMLQSDFLDDIGLLKGKMGLALFFTEYKRHTGENIYENIADDLIDQIFSNAHKQLPVGLNGLCGIGWGVEYLVQNGFMNGNTAEICEDINAKIMEKDPRRITDLSFETGFEGMLHYILAHNKGTANQKSEAFDKYYLSDLFSSLQSLAETDSISESFRRLISIFMSGNLSEYKTELAPFVKSREVDNKLWALPIHIYGGTSGILLNDMNKQ